MKDASKICLSYIEYLTISQNILSKKVYSNSHTLQHSLLGDNETYVGYRNIPLEPETKYEIFYVVVSAQDSRQPKMSYSEAERDVTTLPVVQEADDDNDQMWIIIGKSIVHVNNNLQIIKKVFKCQ